MSNIISRSLMGRLVTFSFLCTIITVGLIMLATFYYSRKSLEEAAFKELSAVREIKKNQIVTFLKNRIGEIRILAESQEAKDAFDVLKVYHDLGGGKPSGSFEVSGNDYKVIYEQIDPFFKKFLYLFDFEDIYFICAAHGHVMYTAKQYKDLGTNLKTGEHRESGLAKLWTKVLEKKKTWMSDFSLYEPTGKAAAFIGTPFLDENQEIIGIVAIQLTPAHINILMQERTGMGQSGETYLVGQDLLMRSDSRFSSASSILKQKIDTLAAQNALKDKAGIEIIKDYRDINVLSAYSHLGLNESLGLEFEWAIIAEIDESEALEPVKNLERQIAMIGTALLFIICLGSYFFARSIASPLKKLSQTVNKISGGDLTVSIDSSNRKDEVGVLVRGFIIMVGTLLSQTRQIIEGSNMLASSVSQISATAAELATSSTQTATSIAEISTTVEEVRQTAHLSNEKANDVLKRSDEVAQISETGKKSTEDTIEGIKRIREEMEYIAESIVKLSEQTQSIGQIISSVNDLADQSNLLSVNASIEAAKAGEHGKGFAVVAQEVKTLAEQSKEATNQVAAILNDIQKATSSAVMATERGSKAVDAGVKLSGEAGGAIRALAGNVTESAQAAFQISSSSQEQLTGMDQLADAMSSIKDASNQNVDAARQLEDAIRGLDDLAQKLKGLAGQFKI